VNEMHADIRIPLFTLLFMALQPTLAEPVYSWVDPAGITHFSEIPPPPGQAEAVQLELPPHPPAIHPGDDYYSVLNQATRMEAQRLEREQVEAQRRQAEAEVWRARAEALTASESATVTPPPVAYRYIPWYPRRGYYPPHHRPHHPQHPGNYLHPRSGNPKQLSGLRLNRPPAMTLPGHR
jgi:hypothetical protein